MLRIQLCIDDPPSLEQSSAMSRMRVARTLGGPGEPINTWVLHRARHIGSLADALSVRSSFATFVALLHTGNPPQDNRKGTVGHACADSW